MIAGEGLRDLSTPESDRPRQPLESFPIEDLQITGVIFDGRNHLAIVQTPKPNKPKHVRVGEFLGKNFGKIVSIDHCKVKINETVRDTNGAWADREVIRKMPQSGGEKCI